MLGGVTAPPKTSLVLVVGLEAGVGAMGEGPAAVGTAAAATGDWEGAGWEVRVPCGVQASAMNAAIAIRTHKPGGGSDFPLSLTLPRQGGGDSRLSPRGRGRAAKRL